MDSAGIYAAIEHHLNNELPLVIYRKPNSSHLRAMLQNDTKLYSISDYDEQGFIFAPFDHDRLSVLIPTEVCSIYESLLTASDYNANDIKQRTEAFLATSSSEERRHKEIISTAIEAIHNGKMHKVVMSRKEQVQHNTSENVLLIFKKLIHKYPTAFVYLWHHPKIGTWLGATPETLLHVSNNELNTMALAGTIPTQNIGSIAWGDKEKEEQKMVTDYIYQGLSSISDCVECSDTYTRVAGTIAHLCTDIKAELRKDSRSLKEIVSILHPTPAVCGLPKKEAYQFIKKNESYDRKFYTGFLGELNVTRGQQLTSHLFVNLRCMELNPNSASIYVGGGITKDSVVENEWQETVRKTATMKQVLG